ncbi:hypothetical protein MBLNU230_g1982t1 [Neophaeotheca triangularis]
MAYLLQRRAIWRQVESELEYAISGSSIEESPTDSPQDDSSEKRSWGNLIPDRVPGVTCQRGKESNSETYYQVDFTGPDDPLNPRAWSTPHRILATFFVCIIAFTVTLSSAIDSAVLDKTTAEFGVSHVAGSLATALFLVAFGLGALVCSPLSELYGRYPVYVGSLCIFACWILGAALAPNFGAHLVFRFLAGFAGSTPLTVAGGTMGDLYNPLEKTWAFPMFAIPAFGGPVFGPVVGGYIGYLNGISWRWSEWVVLIATGAIILITALCTRETYGARILHYKAKCYRKLTGDDRFKTALEASHRSTGTVFRKAFLNPFILAVEPIVMAMTFYMTFIYIVLFTFLEGWPYIFADKYPINTGLANIGFVALFIGLVASLPLVIIVYKKTVKQLQRDGDDGSGAKINREYRVIYAMVGAPALPIGLFWMAWTNYSSISIWAPLAAAIVIGFSNICIFMSAYMYVIDSYEAAAAGALTFVAVVRYLAAGAMTVVATPMYRNLGTHWALSVLAIISVVAMPIPFVLYRFGPSLRRRSRWAV